MLSHTEQALSSILPTLSPLPQELIDLASSLLAQSWTRAPSLKPEEQIARTYACSHIACERLGKKLGLELSGKVNAPCQPRVYAKLKTYLGSVLRTPVTPRKRKVEEVGRDGDGVDERQKAARAEYAASAIKAGEEVMNAVKEVLRNEAAERRQSAAPVANEAATAKDVGAASAPEAEPLPIENQAVDGVNDIDDEDILPVRRRPAKTPLRRKEKHAKRNDGIEDLGPAGLLPGLGTMFQPAVDWLSDERRAKYAQWEKGIMKELAKYESRHTEKMRAIKKTGRVYQSDPL